MTTGELLRAAADDAADALYAPAPRRDRGPIADTTVKWAINVIDRTPLLGMLAQWREQDQRGPGGAPTSFPFQALLVAFVILATLNEPLLLLWYVTFCSDASALQCEPNSAYPNLPGNSTVTDGTRPTATSEPASTRWPG